MNTLETTLILESLAIKRNARLSDIALDMVLHDTPRNPISVEELGKLERENLMDDIAIRQQFLGIVPEVTELHRTHCNNAGVEFCICNVQEPLQGTTEPF